MQFPALRCYFSSYLDTDTALKVSQSVYCLTTSHGVENYFPRLLGMDISDAIFFFFFEKEDGSHRCFFFQSRKVLKSPVLLVLEV